MCSHYRGSLDRQSVLADRRHSREHDRRPSGDISRLQLDEQPVRLRRKSKEAFAVKNKPTKYVDVLFANLVIVTFLLTYPVPQNRHQQKIMIPVHCRCLVEEG